MATTKLGDTPATTIGDLPEVGSAAPDWSLTGTDLGDLDASSLAGQRVVLNIFPSVNTGVCAASVRQFNTLAADSPDTTVVCASADLPFAQQEFCAAEGIDNVVMGSSFRSTFGTDYGVTLTDTPFRELLARAVVVVDGDGTVLHTELVPNIAQEPDYDAAMAALGDA